MLYHNLKVAFRNLSRHKTFFLINIIGLSLAITCTLLILLWVKDEKGVDAFHKQSSRLYAVYERQYNDNKVDAGYYTPGPLGEELKKKIPEVIYASTSRQNNDMYTFEFGDKVLKERGNFAGPDFFRMFSYPFILGNAQTALTSSSSIVISRKMAEDFFGSPKFAMGKSIRFENERNYSVTAVFENLSAQTSDKFDYMISWQSFVENNAWVKQWDNNSPRTYIMLRADANPVLVEQKIKDFLKSYNKFLGPNMRIELGLQRFSDRYLYSDFKNGYPFGGRIEYVRIFTVAALIILLIACVNFMNLMTAASVRRAKEIGVRKVTGAQRSSIAGQFFCETLVVVSLSMIIALMVTTLVLPVFNSFADKEIKLPVKDGRFWFELILLTVVVGLISGSYPAVFLSSFKPIKILKDKLKFNPSIAILRKGLVIFQFALSITLIVGTIVVARQVRYIQTKDIGFAKENLVYIPLEGDLPGKYHVMREDALKMPGVSAVTRITSAPTQILNSTWGVDWTGKDPDSRPLFTTAEVGYGFVKAMKLHLLHGRDFSMDFASDSAGYLINESALQKIGYKDPIGKYLSLWGVKGQIIGVVKDFHFNSLHESINPLIMKLGENDEWGYALVRIEPGKTKQVLNGLQTICKTLNPQFAFDYQFADQDYENLYKSELVINKLSNYFSFLAIFISCLGLLGLIIFTAEQRTKEIGIRKVVGASVAGIITMLSKDILKLVIVSALIASPVAWYVMKKWLQNFVYRVNLEWWEFIVAALLAIIIALVTVSFHTIKAAVANPVRSLRSE